MRRFFLVVVSCGLATLAHAEGTGITVDHAWSRPAMAGRVGVVYMTINDSGAPDTLTGVATPIAGNAMLHVSKTVNGMDEMRMLSSVPVAPGTPARLAPGGMHVMLTGLKRKLAPGDTFPLTLTFAHAGAVTTTVTVEQPGGKQP